jgi:hypothetical protein
VTECREQLYGISQEDYVNALDFHVVDEMMRSICKDGRVIIGHGTFGNLMHFNLGVVARLRQEGKAP